MKTQTRIERKSLAGVGLGTAISTVLGYTGQRFVTDVKNCGDDCLAITVQAGDNIVIYQLEDLDPQLVREFTKPQFIP